MSKYFLRVLGSVLLVLTILGASPVSADIYGSPGGGGALFDADGARVDTTGDGGGLNITPPAIGKSDVVGTIPKLIKSAFDIIIIVASVVFVVLLLLGGIMYLTSFGNDEQSKKAKTLLLDAVIGLVIVVTAWAVGNYVLKLLGLGIDL